MAYYSSLLQLFKSGCAGGRTASVLYPRALHASFHLSLLESILSRSPHREDKSEELLLEGQLEGVWSKGPSLILVPTPHGTVLAHQHFTPSPCSPNLSPITQTTQDKYVVGNN